MHKLLRQLEVQLVYLRKTLRFELDLVKQEKLKKKITNVHRADNKRSFHGKMRNMLVLENLER